MDFSPSEKEPVRVQSFVEHLGDLRKVLFRSILAVGLGFLICFQYADRILFFLKAPILRELPQNHQQLYYFGLMEQFYTHLKVSTIASIFLTSPFLIWQLWIFISPALKESERKLVVPFVLGSTGAFLL
ncbi:preprotein translocase subunit TatC, partial [bacterium]|nr:preprotein translocase subunit TatC [bacterium]